MLRFTAPTSTVSTLLQAIPVKSNGGAKGPRPVDARCDVDLAGRAGAARRGPWSRLPENVPYRCRADNRLSLKLLDSGVWRLPWTTESLRLCVGV